MRHYSVHCITAQIHDRAKTADGTNISMIVFSAYGLYSRENTTLLSYSVLWQSLEQNYVFQFNAKFGENTCGWFPKVFATNTHTDVLTLWLCTMLCEHGDVALHVASGCNVSVKCCSFIILCGVLATLLFYHCMLLFYHCMCSGVVLSGVPSVFALLFNISHCVVPVWAHVLCTRSRMKEQFMMYNVQIVL